MEIHRLKSVPLEAQLWRMLQLAERLV